MLIYFSSEFHSSCLEVPSGGKSAIKNSLSASLSKLLGTETSICYLFEKKDIVFDTSDDKIVTAPKQLPQKLNCHSVVFKIRYKEAFSVVYFLEQWFSKPGITTQLQVAWMVPGHGKQHSQ